MSVTISALRHPAFAPLPLVKEVSMAKLIICENTSTIHSLVECAKSHCKVQRYMIPIVGRGSEELGPASLSLKTHGARRHVESLEKSCINKSV